MHPFSGTFEAAEPFCQLNLHVGNSSLAVPMGYGADAQARRFWGSPFDVERGGHERSIGPPPCFRRIIEQHCVGLVPETPLGERAITHMVGPHLGRLDLETCAQIPTIEFFDVQVRLAGAHEARPVIEARSAKLDADVSPTRLVLGRHPPPPRFDGDIAVTELIDIAENRTPWVLRIRRGRLRRCRRRHGIDTTLSPVRYLSLDWIDAVAAEAASNDAVAAAAESCSIGVTQVVTDTPEGTVIYSLQTADGQLTFAPGQAFPEDVRFEQNWETAVGVATGAVNAQEAFIQGRILLTGDQQKLMDCQPVFGAMGSVFDSVRQRTEYE